MISREQNNKNEADAHEVARLRVPVVYTAIRQEGMDELSRPLESLWWSGVAAGLAIFLSVVGTGALTYYIGDEEGPSQLLKHFGYTMGFLAVILGRLQLFTENTITAVIPLLAYWTRRTFNRLIKLWFTVFMANMVGVFIAAAATVYGNIFPAGITEGIVEVSRHYIHHRTALDFFAQGVPAGFIVAGLVWMLPSSRGFEFFVIIIMTYLISLAGLTHVIAGSGEVFVMMLMGEISFADSVLVSILPTFAGNVLGGTALFALLAHAQVKEEI